MTAHLDEPDLVALGRAGAASAMRAFLASAARGRTASPPRWTVPLGGRALVFTIGADLELGVGGFRMYSIGPRAEPVQEPTQTVVLLDLATGAVLAQATHAAYGAWRTAAIGAVALEEALRGRRAPVRAAVLGAGVQAHHQARAWAATGLVGEFAVWARRREAAASFCAALARETGLAAEEAPTPGDALQGAGAVLCATSSPTPTFPAAALGADVYVATLGPKFGGAHEVPSEVYERAAFLLTDAPAQVAEHERQRGALPGGRRAAEAIALSELVAGRAAVSAPGLRLFLSEGLAGTEVALLRAVLEARRGT